MLQQVAYYSDDEDDMLEWPASGDEGSGDTLTNEEKDPLDEFDSLCIFDSCQKALWGMAALPE